MDYTRWSGIRKITDRGDDTMITLMGAEFQEMAPLKWNGLFVIIAQKENEYERRK